MASKKTTSKKEVTKETTTGSEDALVLTGVIFKPQERVYFYISHQDASINPAEEFEFEASNGVEIYSMDCPDVDNFSGALRLYVRGEDKDSDLDVSSCSLEEWDRIRQAVKELNASFKKTPECTTSNSDIEMVEVR